MNAKYEAYAANGESGSSRAKKKRRISKPVAAANNFSDVGVLVLNAYQSPHFIECMKKKNTTGLSLKVRALKVQELLNSKK